MALFRRFFYKNPPDRLLQISERVFVFNCCLSRDVLGEDEYKVYLDGVVAQLQDHYPDASFMVFNFREGDQMSQISDILTQHDMIVMDYPRQYESCPLLPLEMIHHFLRSSESWLSLEGQQNVLLMHCEKGGWPVLAFMLSGLLLYKRQYQGEQKTLEMVQKQASKDLLLLLSPLNPQPSQLRYLQYISRRNLCFDWPPLVTPLLLDCLILRDLPHFEGRKGCRPILRVYGQDPESRANRSSTLLFSTPKTKKHTFVYQEEQCILVTLDVQCCVQGDVVLECIHLHDDLVTEEMIFRVMFHTAFVRANILTLQLDDMDILWDSKDQFPKNFKAEVLFSGADALVSTITTAEDDNDEDIASRGDEVEEIFSDVIDGPDYKRDLESFVVVDTTSDDLEGKDVWKGDVEPNAFLDCASDDSTHKHDLDSDTSTNSVKDITIADVQCRSDGKADSSLVEKSSSLPAVTPSRGPPSLPCQASEATSVLPSSQSAASPRPPPPPPPLPYMCILPSILLKDPPINGFSAPPSPPGRTASPSILLTDSMLSTIITSTASSDDDTYEGLFEAGEIICSPSSSTQLPSSLPPPPPPLPLPWNSVYTSTSCATNPNPPPPSICEPATPSARPGPPPPPPPPSHLPYMRIIPSVSPKGPPTNGLSAPPSPPGRTASPSILLTDSMMSTIITSTASSDDDNYEGLFEAGEIFCSPFSTTQLPSSLPPPPPPLPLPWNSVYTSTSCATNSNPPPPSICESEPPSARPGPPPPPPPPPPPRPGSRFSF